VKFPEDIRKILGHRYKRKQREWLSGLDRDGQWPLQISLGIPSEQVVRKQMEDVRTWVSAWRSWQGMGTLHWSERKWRSLGTQPMPESLHFKCPREVTFWLEETRRWDRACSRYQTCINKWPTLAKGLPRFFDVLADYEEVDFLRLLKVLEWLKVNPSSHLYPRELPIFGVHSKWLETRKSLISELMVLLREDTCGERDFYKICGLKSKPSLMRIRLLDEELRSVLGGLGDISAPATELERLNMSPKHVFIVENLQTGLAFLDIPKTVVIMGLGYAVDVLGRLPWLREARCFYWGDLDTHGFAILNRARSFVPHLSGILMDESTLMSHRDLWVQEKNQHAKEELSLLSGPEQSLYQSLKNNKFGENIRLEQERVQWCMAWPLIQASSSH
jgi:hypothetical protein